LEEEDDDDEVEVEPAESNHLVVEENFINHNAVPPSLNNNPRGPQLLFPFELPSEVLRIQDFLAPPMSAGETQDEKDDAFQGIEMVPV
jgi:hypothetical protein